MVNTPEQDIWESMGRGKGRKRKLQPTMFEPYESIYQDYYTIYYDYLLNLLMSEFKYENAPITFEPYRLEWMLRTIGWCEIVAVDKDHIFVEGGSDGGISINSEIGALFSNASPKEYGPSARDLIGGSKVTKLSGQNSGTAKLPVSVVLSNKLNVFTSPNVTDNIILDRTARTLAEIKASEITNIRQQKTPFIGFTKDGSLTAKKVWEQLQSGRPFISVDKDVANYDNDLDKILKIVPTQTPNLAPALKDSWNDTMNEFLTFMGLDSMAVDKKERLVTAEAESNDQQVSISASVYLDSRNRRLDILNEAIGTNIHAKMNFETLEDTLEIINRDAPKGDDDDDETQRLDSADE